MGRSVSFPAGAQVAYRLFDSDEPDDDGWSYESLSDDIRATARAVFPSFECHEGWRGREDRVLLRNSYADIGVSVYGGIAAIWIVERDDGIYWDRDMRTGCSGRARHWLQQVASKFSDTFAELERMGRMSNGECVYRLNPQFKPCSIEQTSAISLA